MSLCDMVDRSLTVELASCFGVHMLQPQLKYGAAQLSPLNSVVLNLVCTLEPPRKFFLKKD